MDLFTVDLLQGVADAGDGVVDLHSPLDGLEFGVFQFGSDGRGEMIAFGVGREGSGFDSMTVVVEGIAGGGAEVGEGSDELCG